MRGLSLLDYRAGEAGELSGGGAEAPAVAGREQLVNCSERPAPLAPGRAQSTFILPAPKGRRCESAFALLSHKKVTKRLWPAASYGKIRVVGYRLLQERDG